MLILGIPGLPAGLAPGASASPVWTTTTDADFTGEGSSFFNCSVNGTGAEARIVLNNTPLWFWQSNWTKPPGRILAAMAAIGSDDKVVLFGGKNAVWTGDLGFDDTWVYDCGDNLWRRMDPPDKPSWRSGSAMATIPNDDKVVLFGGYDNNRQYCLNDTWIYDLSDDEWYLQDPAPSPPPRCQHGMATLFEQSKVVLFGGASWLWGNPMGDTWVYDTIDRRWTQQFPSKAPLVRYSFGLASIWQDDRVVLFGGYAFKEVGETWVYDLGDNTWTCMRPEGEPSPRYGQAMATIFFDDKVVMYGGMNSTSYPGIFYCETWIYDPSDNQWSSTMYPPQGTPRGMVLMVMAALNEGRRVVLFGGTDGEYGFPGVNDTWIYDRYAHLPDGYYRSPYFDAGGNATFKTLGWKAALPNGTSIEFQLRTASTLYGLLKREFTGPDGTPNTTYTCATSLWSGQTVERWVQYMAFFRTTDRSVSPMLDEVELGYGLLPPAPTLLEPATAAWLNSTRHVFTWSYNDSETGRQGAFEWQLDSSIFFERPRYSSGEVKSNLTSYTPPEPIEEGTWYWRVRAQDEDGDWGPFSMYRALRIDLTPPEPFVPSVDPAGWTGQPCSVYFITTDALSGLDRFELLLDGESCGIQESPFPLPELPDGRHRITVRAFDIAGNFAEGNATALVDRGRPEPFTPSIDPPSWTSGRPTVLFETTDSASGVNHYEVQIDGAGFSEETSPYVLPNLKDGEHAVLVRAFDWAGNFEDGSVKACIDSKSPVGLVISISPASWTNTNPTIAFLAQDASSGIERYEVILPGGVRSNRSSPFVILGLAEGVSKIEVRAYDRAGNLAEGSVEAFIDRGPPDPFQPAAEPANWTRSTPVITYSASDKTSGIGHYEVGVDGGGFTTRASPWSLAGLPDGRHVIAVRAFDLAGNFAEGTVPVYFDATPPSVSLLIEGGSASTDSEAVRLTINASDGASGPDCMCFSDDGLNYSGWEPFASGKNWTLSPGAGKKTVFVKVMDRAGNEAGAHATIEHTAPARDARQAPPIAAIILAAAALAALLAFAWMIARAKSRPGRKDRAGK